MTVASRERVPRSVLTSSVMDDGQPSRPPDTVSPASPYFTNREAAAYLRLSPQTLEKYRVIGGGPRFRKLGRRVFYTLADLKEWGDKRICDSTSDPAWSDGRK